MKARLMALGFIFSLSATAQTVLSEKTDDKFGGYYVNIESSRSSLSRIWKRPVGIADVLNLQKLLRDCLVFKSKSFLRQKQEAYLSQCLALAEEKIRPSHSANEQKGFTIVFDMDETLLTQWSKISLENPRLTTFIVTNRDHILAESKSEMTLAPFGVTVRPGVLKLLASLAENPRVGRIYFFTAREDKSAVELKNYFLQKVSTLKSKFGGVYARNFLRLDGETNTPSKDLRIFSPSLRNILLIDDNPTRVMQKELSFTIPKFNADLYLNSLAKHDLTVIEANEMVAPFVDSLIKAILQGINFKPYSTLISEQNKIDWGKEILKRNKVSPGIIEELLKEKIFQQDFFGAETIRL
jgi:hypothetical protein